MSMIELTIDGKAVKANGGATVLDAARSAGIDIPTMCHCDKIAPAAACFVCAVKIDKRKNFLPSCATAARNGMTVITNSEEVRECRKHALELLLSEHAGSCEAPCAKICPCGLDVPEVMRNLQSGDIDAAASIIRRQLPFPATLGYVCQALCQKGCRRSAVDTSLPIQRIHRIIAENAINAPAGGNVFNIVPKQKNAVIIGGGPAGLSAAFFLAINGYNCTVCESRQTIGGALRNRFDESALPRRILDSEINFIANLGVRLFTNAKIDSLDELCRNYDAVIIATGARNQNDNHQFNLEHDEHGIKICHDTFATDLPKVFACGSAVKPVRFVARSMGQGKAAAAAVDRYLRGIAPHKQFFTNTGHLSDAEIESLAGSIPFARKNDPRINPPSENDIIDADTDIDINISIDDDPNRCLLCDCGKKNGCSLRDYSAQYGAHHLRYAADRRKPYIRKLYGGGLVHEPGKCISCGKCVGLTRERNVKPGLSFSGRGSDVCVSAPFGTPFDAAMGDALAECVAACPTGALWIRN